MRNQSDLTTGVIDFISLPNRQTKTEDFMRFVVSTDKESDRNYWNESQWSSFISQKDIVLLFFLSDIKRDETLIGFLAARFAENFSELLKICVLPNARNQGIGNVILAEYIDLVRAKNKDKIFLEVEVGNQQAIYLYTKSGFSISRTRKNYYGINRDALEMVLTLKTDYS